MQLVYKLISMVYVSFETADVFYTKHNNCKCTNQAISFKTKRQSNNVWVIHQ